MGRKLRVQYPGAIYHLMNRGDRREPIFQDALDRQRFLKASTQRPPWLRVDRLFGEMGLPQDSRAARRQFELRMEERRAQQAGEE